MTKKNTKKQQLYPLDIELPVPTSKCTEISSPFCTGKFVRTQGRDQEVCLICQRDDVDHTYVSKKKEPKKKKVGGNKYYDVYEDFEELFNMK